MLNLTDYPKKKRLSDGREVEIRLLSPGDEVALLKFMEALPPEERTRFRHDVTNPAVIHDWTHVIDLKNVVPLIARYNDEIAANWSLHHKEHGWTRHHSNIRGIVAPKWRGVGLATLMVHELLLIAGQMEIENLVIQLIGSQEKELDKYKNVGFEVAAVLNNWIKDFQGRYHDMIILSMKLEPAWKKMEEMILDYGTHGG